MDKHEATSRVSLAAALRHVLAQLAKLLEHDDALPLLAEGAPFELALQGWRKAVATQTSSATVKRARELEHAKLELMGRVAQLQKERDDFQERNKELLDQLVKQKRHEEAIKQRLLEAQFAGGGLKAEAKRLDLEIRELRRRVRELEGGPPLTPAEAAPQSQPAAAEAKSKVTDPLPAEVEAPSVAGQAESGGPVAPPAPLRLVPPPLAAVPLAHSDRRAAAEQAFRDLWKPKAQEAPPEVAAAPALPVPAAAAAESPAPAAPVAQVAPVARAVPPTDERVSPRRPARPRVTRPAAAPTPPQRETPRKAKPSPRRSAAKPKPAPAAKAVAGDKTVRATKAPKIAPPTPPRSRAAAKGKPVAKPARSTRTAAKQAPVAKLPAAQAAKPARGAASAPRRKARAGAKK